MMSQLAQKTGNQKFADLNLASAVAGPQIFGPDNKKPLAFYAICHHSPNHKNFSEISIGSKVGGGKKTWQILLLHFSELEENVA